MLPYFAPVAKISEFGLSRELMGFSKHLPFCVLHRKFTASARINKALPAALFFRQLLISLSVPPQSKRKGAPMPLCRKAILALSFFSILGLNIPLTAQDGSSTGKCSFQSQTIPAPAGTNALPTDLNDNGVIVGFLQQGTGASFHITGFLFSGGKFTHFRFPGSADTLPQDINKHGVIVGSFEVTGGNGQRAFMVQAGVFHEVKIPGFPNAPAIATGVNDLGDITGQFNGNGSNFGFLLHNGKLTIISFPGAQGGTFPNSINNQGMVVGTYHVFEEEIPNHGFMWKNGVFSNIQVPGAVTTIPKKIGDNGDIVGSFVDSNQSGHGFSFDHGRYSTIDPPGSQGTQLVALNNFDNILGFFATAKSNVLFKGFCSSVF
jgi:hypothetical protein